MHVKKQIAIPWPRKLGQGRESKYDPFFIAAYEEVLG
jgi:hypothetical protein